MDEKHVFPRARMLPMMVRYVQSTKIKKKYVNSKMAIGLKSLVVLAQDVFFNKYIREHDEKGDGPL